MFFVSSLSSISRVRRTTMWSLESIWKKSYPHQIRQKWANHDIGKVYPLFVFKKTSFAAWTFVHLTWKQLVIADTYIRLFDFEYSVGLVLLGLFSSNRLLVSPSELTGHRAGWTAIHIEKKCFFMTQPSNFTGIFVDVGWSSGVRPFLKKIRFKNFSQSQQQINIT